MVELKKALYGFMESLWKYQDYGMIHNTLSAYLFSSKGFKSRSELDDCYYLLHMSNLSWKVVLSVVTKIAASS